MSTWSCAACWPATTSRRKRHASAPDSPVARDPSAAATRPRIPGFALPPPPPRPAMNVEQARFNMIEQQIRPWDVLDQSVLSLLAVVKREDFVPAAYRALAFVDTEVPLPAGQSMLAPKVEARLLQELDVKK